MTTVREPLLEPVAILDLRPTQITVGMREVEAKRKEWRATKKGEKFLGTYDPCDPWTKGSPLHH